MVCPIDPNVMTLQEDLESKMRRFTVEENLIKTSMVVRIAMARDCAIYEGEKGRRGWREGERGRGEAG